MTLKRHAMRSALGAAVIACACAAPAAAGDWTIRTSMLERLSANDNINLVEDPEGIVFGSYSSLQVDATARSHVYEFVLDGTLGYQAYFGDSGDIPEDRFLPSLRTSYLRKSKDTDFNFAASYVLEPATDNTTDPLIPEPIASGDRQTISANTSVVHRVNARNDLTLAARATRIDFIDAAPADVPSTSLGTSLLWNRKLSKRTSYNLTNSLDWYGYENAIDSEKYYYTVRGGLSSNLSKRLSVNGSLGASVTDSYRDNPAKTDRLHNTSMGVLASGGFSYLLKSGSITGAASYGLTPDDNGRLTNALTLSSGLSYRINDLTNFSLSAQYRLTDRRVAKDVEALADSSFSLSPSLSYALARDWQLSASYQFSMVEDEDGEVFQNAVYLTLSRSYVLLP